MRYVALLRGINVGGKNKVPMADLRECMERAGYENVSTYIASGNVLFDTTRPAGSLEKHIERALELHFKLPLVVVVRSRKQLEAVVANAPKGFGTQPGKYHSDAVFLKKPLTASQAMKVVELREGVDEVWPGTGVLYFQRVSAKRAQSKLSKIASTPDYQRMTIRSWQTVQKLAELFQPPEMRP